MAVEFAQEFAVVARHADNRTGRPPLDHGVHHARIDEVGRLRERIAQREKRREGKKTDIKPSPTKDELSKLKNLSDRFLRQSHAENARDPDLRRAQSLVAQTILIARAKYPDVPVKASKEVEARRQEVGIRIANGDRIVMVQVRNQ